MSNYVKTKRVVIQNAETGERRYVVKPSRSTQVIAPDGTRLNFRGDGHDRERNAAAEAKRARRAMRNVIQVARQTGMV